MSTYATFVSGDIHQLSCPELLIPFFRQDFGHGRRIDTYEAHFTYVFRAADDLLSFRAFLFSRGVCHHLPSSGLSLTCGRCRIGLQSPRRLPGRHHLDAAWALGRYGNSRNTPGESFNGSFLQPKCLWIA